MVEKLKKIRWSKRNNNHILSKIDVKRVTHQLSRKLKLIKYSGSKWSKTSHEDAETYS